MNCIPAAPFEHNQSYLSEKQVIYIPYHRPTAKWRMMAHPPSCQILTMKGMEDNAAIDTARRPMKDAKAASACVQVVAPCDMEAGFTLMVTHGERSFPVTVPEGGVRENQVFQVAMKTDRFLLRNSTTNKPGSSGGITTATETTPLFLGGNMVATNTNGGKWKDGLFDCFRFGFCHASVLNAVFCPTIIMAQILTRLNLNLFAGSNSSVAKSSASLKKVRARSWSDTSRSDGGSQENTQPNSPVSSSSSAGGDLEAGRTRSNSTNVDDTDQSTKNGAAATFRTLFWLTCCFWLLWIVLSPPFPPHPEDPGTLRDLAFYTPRYVSPARWFFFKASILAGVLYIIVVLTRLRRFIRQQDRIANSCGIVEDAIVSLCCTCCALAHLARHTGEYEHKGQRAACCSPTGLGDVEFYSEETPQPLWHSNTTIPWPNEEPDDMQGSPSQNSRRYQHSTYSLPAEQDDP